MVALDGAVRDMHVDLGDVAAYADVRRRWRGVPLLRRALPLVDPHSGSPGESRYRWVWVVEAGLPVPVLNREVRSADGALLGVADLLAQDLALVGEYDGSTHADSGVARRTTPERSCSSGGA